MCCIFLILLLFQLDLINAGLPSTCTLHDGQAWCTHPTQCGVPCQATCEALSMLPLSDANAWFEAQNTNEKCQALSAALGMNGADVDGYELGCLEEGDIPDERLFDANNTPLLYKSSGLLCSTKSTCPNYHLTLTDGEGADCSQNGFGGRLAICPCGEGLLHPQCAYQQNFTPCDDGDPSTVNNVCLNGVCNSTALPQTTLAPTPQLTLAPIPQFTSLPTHPPAPSMTLQPTNIPTPPAAPSMTRRPTNIPTPRTTLKPTPLPQLSTPPLTSQPTAKSEATSSPTQSIPVYTNPPYPQLTPIPVVAPVETAPPVPVHTVPPVPTVTGQPSPITSPTSVPSPEITPDSISVNGIVVFEGPIIDNCSIGNAGVLDIRFNDENPSHDCAKDEDDETDDPANSCAVIGADNEYGDQTFRVDGIHNAASAACFPLVEDHTDEEIVSLIVVLELESGDGFNNYSLAIPVFGHESEKCSNIDIEDTLVCKWYNNATSDWEETGCEADGMVDQDGSKYLVCVCSHLTAFAVLQNVAIVEERCRLSTVIGSYVWLVSAALYSVVFITALIQFLRCLQSRNVTVHLVVHLLIAFIGCLNLILSLLLYAGDPKSGEKHVHILTLSVLWAFSYVLSFWTFSLLVYTWANVFHSSISGGTPKRLKYALVVSVVCLSALVIILFIAAGTQTRSMKLIAPSGSITIAVICLFMSLIFMVYGVLLIRKIKESTVGGKQRADMRDLMDRLGKVTRTISGAFVCESVVLLISVLATEIFYAHFSIFHILYFVFDFFMLFAVMYLFYRVMGAKAVPASTST